MKYLLNVVFYIIDLQTPLPGRTAAGAWQVDLKVED